MCSAIQGGQDVLGCGLSERKLGLRGLMDRALRRLESLYNRSVLFEGGDGVDG